LNTLCQSSKHLNQDDEAQPELLGIDLSPDNNGSQAFLFAKHHYMIDGNGYECSIQTTTYTFKTTFLFQQTTNNEHGVVSMSPLECWNMVQEQECNKVKMKMQAQRRM
jgi:hypothetical protein